MTTRWLLISLVCYLFVHSSLGQSADELVWATITPSDNLRWVTCYNHFQCARLKVPLDYSKPGKSPAVLAVIRLQANVSTHSSEYRGPILINPGGPGDPGVDFMLVAGQPISAAIGPQFDIVSFDPRGVGRSTPAISFYKSAAERAVSKRNDLVAFNESADVLPKYYANSRLINQLVAERDGSFLSQINTENTARDMLRIVQAYGRNKLQYWGFSYGSVLGATFAALFPDRVERLIIDGIVDAENYFAALWSNLIDTNKTMQAFLDGCVKAGPEACALHETTPEAVAQRLTALYESARTNPVPVRTNISYGLVDYTRLRTTVFASLYTPYQSFQPLAQALAQLEAGNGTALYQILESPMFECNCSSPQVFTPNSDAAYGIICTDGDDVNMSSEESRQYYLDLAKTSEWAEIWARLRISCVGWPKQQKSFRGPFVGNTSHPILLIGNTADPVTPLQNAHKMSAGYTGSVVLTQDSPGHTSLTALSTCTGAYVRAYFLNGTLPDPGTICGVDQELFPSNSSSVNATADSTRFGLML